MNSIDEEYLEDQCPEVLKNMYNQETIDSMIDTMKSLNLDKNSEQYKSFVLSIQEAIHVFESNSGEKYKYQNDLIKDELEENDLIRQMQEFNKVKNNIVSIQDGSEYQPTKIKEERSGVKKIVDKLLQKLKKKS